MTNSDFLREIPLGLQERADILELLSSVSVQFLFGAVRKIICNHYQATRMNQTTILNFQDAKPIRGAKYIYGNFTKYYGNIMVPTIMNQIGNQYICIIVN